MSEQLREWIAGVVAMARSPVDQVGGPPVSDADLVAYAMTADVVARIEELEAALATYGTDVMWVCFGCGAEFAESEYEAAADHFGMPGVRARPSCIKKEALSDG